MVGTSNIIAILLVLNLVDASPLVRGSAFEYSKDQSAVQQIYFPINEPECPDPPGENCIPVNSTHQSNCPQKYECFLDLAQEYEDIGSGFYPAPTVPCPFDVEYVESCGKCDQCPHSPFLDMCYEFNKDTCNCELKQGACIPIPKHVVRSAPICNVGVTFVHEPCYLCATCPVNECQVFNAKTCRCHTKLSCRARAAKLKACAHPEAEYVENCGTCAVCSDECQWFNTQTCKCQTATSWEGCAK